MFDKTREHSTIWGDSHARYFQDGKYFNGRGNEVDAETGEELNVSVDPYDSMHWTKLKKLVLENDGEWDGIQDGIKFLKGL